MPSAWPRWPDVREASKNHEVRTPATRPTPGWILSPGPGGVDLVYGLTSKDITAGDNAAVGLAVRGNAQAYVGD